MLQKIIFKIDKNHKNDIIKTVVSLRFHGIIYGNLTKK